jgi:hypothetical protein
MSQLNGLFGEHTFFLDHNGLSILEPVDAAGAVPQSARIVNLANWSMTTRRLIWSLTRPKRQMSLLV